MPFLNNPTTTPYGEMIGEVTVDDDRFLKWCRDEMVLKGHVRVVGELGTLAPLQAVDALPNASIYCALIVKMRDSDQYVYFQVGYKRYGESTEQPILDILVLQAATLQELIEDELRRSIKVPMGWFVPGPESSGRPETVMLRINYGTHAPEVRVGDPWMIYHLGVIAQMVRDIDIATLEAGQLSLDELEAIRAVMAHKVDMLASARIGAILTIHGRR